MSGHASLAPSNAGTWVPCPGSIAMEESIPEAEREGSSPYAQLGTAAHGLLERCLTTGDRPEDYAGRVIELVGDGYSILHAAAAVDGPDDRVVFTVDEDMIEAVGVAVAHVHQRVEDLGAEFMTERRVRVLDSRDDCYGTADVTIDAWPDLLEVDDYKNGSGVVVEVTDNYQLRSYLLGAAREDKFSHDSYAYAVIQPRAYHPDGHVRTETVTRNELLEFERELEGAAENVDKAREVMAEGHDGPQELYRRGFLDVGEDGSHCRFCGALSFCPAARAFAAEKAGADFDDEPHTLEVPADPEILGGMLRWVPFLDNLCRQVQVHAQRVAEAGGSIAFHKLVRKKSPGRKWRALVDVVDGEEGETAEATDEAVLGIMKDEFGVARKAMMTKPARITGPQAEKLVRKELRADFEARLLHKPEGGLALAPEDDGRDEVTVDPGSDFEDEDG